MDSAEPSSTHRLTGGDVAGLSPVLVIAAHPDDIESWAGGTVALARSAGASVTYTLCTSGDKGTRDPDASSWTVAKLREAEQLEAANRLGVSRVVFLRFPDGELEESQELRGRIVRVIRQTRPRLLITFDPEHPYPPYLAHRDHRVVGRVAIDAAFPYARDRLHFPNQIENEGLQPHKVDEIWLMATVAGDHCVDISSVFDQKMTARLAHASQVSDPVRQRGAIHTRDARFGAEFGVELAEVFKRLVLAD